MYVYGAVFSMSFHSLRSTGVFDDGPLEHMEKHVASKEKYYYLVYMTKGGLTSRDESMLLDVKDHFQQRLDERGVLMDWLWLDAWIFRRVLGEVQRCFFVKACVEEFECLECLLSKCR